MSFEIMEQISELGKAMTSRASQIGVSIEVKINGKPMKLVDSKLVKPMRKPHVRCNQEDIESDRKCIVELIETVAKAGGVRRDVILAFKQRRPSSSSRFYQRLNSLNVEEQSAYQNLPTNKG